MLVVIDDVIDSLSQLDMLLPPRQRRQLQPRLHPSSYVIVTSRNGGLLKQRCDAVIEVKLLHEDLACKLFGAYAFEHAPPSAEVTTLVPDIVKCCQGLPLTLQVRHPGTVQCEMSHACTLCGRLSLISLQMQLCSLHRSWVRICPTLATSRRCGRRPSLGCVMRGDWGLSKTRCLRACASATTSWTAASSSSFWTPHSSSSVAKLDL